MLREIFPWWFDWSFRRAWIVDPRSAGEVQQEIERDEPRNDEWRGRRRGDFFAGQEKEEQGPITFHLATSQTVCRKIHYLRNTSSLTLLLEFISPGLFWGKCIWMPINMHCSMCEVSIFALTCVGNAARFRIFLMGLVVFEFDWQCAWGAFRKTFISYHLWNAAWKKWILWGYTRTLSARKWKYSREVSEYVQWLLESTLQCMYALFAVHSFSITRHFQLSSFLLQRALQPSLIIPIQLRLSICFCVRVPCFFHRQRHKWHKRHSRYRSQPDRSQAVPFYWREKVVPFSHLLIYSQTFPPYECYY